MKTVMATGEWTLIFATLIRIRRWMRDDCTEMAASQRLRSIKQLTGMKTRVATPILLILAFLSGIPSMAGSQAMPYAEVSSNTLATASSIQPYPAYSRPTEKTKFRNYVFDAYGPYPVVAAGFAAGVNQLNNTPPEWHQGAEGFGRRFGSDFGIAVASTTTRYALSEAFKEDALYYRCECQGVLPRLGHAAFSTLTARRGQDGHRVFSVPALIAPYAGSMTAVYGWYPDRYGAKDAFRMGNYSLLIYAGGNIAMEFLYSGPHSLLSRVHLGKTHGGPESGPAN
jgi:hypothetical protein